MDTNRYNGSQPHCDTKICSASNSEQCFIYRYLTSYLTKGWDETTV